jgi:hypothetical protein
MQIPYRHEERPCDGMHRPPSPYPQHDTSTSWRQGHPDTRYPYPRSNLKYTDCYSAPDPRESGQHSGQTYMQEPMVRSLYTSSTPGEDSHYFPMRPAGPLVQPHYLLLRHRQVHRIKTHKIGNFVNRMQR